MEGKWLNPCAVALNSWQNFFEDLEAFWCLKSSQVLYLVLGQQFLCLQTPGKRPYSLFVIRMHRSFFYLKGRTKFGAFWLVDWLFGCLIGLEAAPGSAQCLFLSLHPQRSHCSNLLLALHQGIASSSIQGSYTVLAI